MRHALQRIFLLLQACASAAWALPDTTADLILQHDIQLPGHAAGSGASSDELVVLVELSGATTSKTLDRRYLAEVIRDKLRRSGVVSRSFPGSFRQSFLARSLPATVLRSPKLVIDIEIRQQDDSDGYWSNCMLTAIEHHGGSDLRARKLWSARQEIKGISREAIEDNIGRYVQEEAGRFAALWKKLHPGRPAPVPMREDSAPVAYRARWNDPDPKRNSLFVGVSAGTPALGNLHLGYWGGDALPIVVSVSGMYYGTFRRGFQIESGVAFDNDGSLKQVAGLSLMGTNESTTTSRHEHDEFGRVTRTTWDTVHALRFYLGPVYTADWKNIRAQAGFGLRAHSAAQSNVRFLFQLGYTLPIKW